MTEPTTDPAYLALLLTDRVSAHTRKALFTRSEPVSSDYEPVALSAGELAILRCLMSRLLPQRTGCEIDLAARLDAAMAAQTGDGWRFASLPSDEEAYRLGLRTLDAEARAYRGCGFAGLDEAAQDELLERAAAGSLASECGLSSVQMQRWFEDVRADAVKVYVSHPATMARIAYSGPAYGGDGPRKQGFTALGPGEREAWEPVAR